MGKASKVLMVWLLRRRKRLELLKKRLFITLMVTRLKMFIRERNFLHSQSLLKYVTLCPWYKLYRDGDDSDLVAVISLTRASFEHLLSEFRKHFTWKYGITKGGRPPRVVDKHCALALLLHTYNSPAEHKTWCEMFGIVPSTLSRTLEKAEVALQKTLKNLPEAVIEWPSREEQVRLASLVQARKGTYCCR